MLGVVRDEAGSGVGGGLEAETGVREGEGLACEGAEAGVLEGLCMSDGVSGFVGPIVAGGDDEEEAAVGAGGVGLEPALGDVAGLLMGGVAGALEGGEAGGDGGVSVEDAEVDFGLGEVPAGAVGGGVKEGGVAQGVEEGADSAQEGVWIRGGIAEGCGIEGRGDAVPLFVFRHQDGGDEVLVEFDGEEGVEFVAVAEGDEVKPNGVGEGNMPAFEVLGRGADGSQRRGANAVVGGLQLGDERLRRRDGVVYVGELQRAEVGAGGECGRRYDDLLRRRSSRWSGPDVMALRHGCADDAEQS